MNRSITNRFTRAVAHSSQMLRSAALLAVAGVFVASCDVHRISSAGSLTTLSISPNPKTITVNGTQQFTASGVDESGAPVTLTPVWSVVAGGGAINSDGMFTAGPTPNTFTNTIQVTSGGKTATATVVLIAGSLATITVTPTPVTLGTSTAQQFTAVGQDAIGNVIPIAPVWSIVAGGGTIATTTGLFTSGTTAGTFTNTVRASIGNIAGFATVVVTSGALANINVTPNPVTLQANGTQQFVATGTDAGGNAFVITPVWSVVSGGGTINASTGVFTAGLTAGTFPNTVKATSGAISGTATVTVTVPSPVLTTITVIPNPVTLLPGATQQFAATGRDASGNIIPLAPVWSVVAGGGTINASSGLFTAGPFTGTFTNTVKATSGAVSGTATVIVQSPPVIPPNPIVDLKTAGLNGIMAGTAFTCVSGGIINANIAIAPGNTVTGFPPCVVTGVQHLNDAIAVQGQIDLTNAYNTLAGLPCPPANAIVGNLGGTTKAPGVYCTASGIGVTGTLTLDGNGDPNAYFVFQAGSSLTTAGNIVLINGAQAKNVYWQVGSSATIGTASQWQGNILALTSISLLDNATLFGRALARNGAVSQTNNNVITLP